MYKCTVCKKTKASTEFRASRRDLDPAIIRRCTACETCLGCEKSFSEYRKLDCNAQMCTTCCRQAARKACSVCAERLGPEAFPINQWKRTTRLDRNLYLRCLTCHTCVSCDDTKKDIRAFARDEKACKACCRLAARKTCAVCAESLREEAYPNSQWKQSTRRDRNLYLRCLKCHTCVACKTERTVKAFRDDAPTCRHCRTSQTSLLCDACHEKKPGSAFDDDVLKNALNNRASASAVLARPTAGRPRT